MDEGTDRRNTVTFGRPDVGRILDEGLRCADMHFHTNYSDSYTSVKWALKLEIEILVTASKSTGKSGSAKAIVTTAFDWNVYPVFLALMTWPDDAQRNRHETETAKRIVAAVQQKAIAL